MGSGLGPGAGHGSGGLEPLRGGLGDAGGAPPPGAGPAPSHPPVHLWAPAVEVPGRRLVAGRRLPGHHCCFQSEGSDQLVGQVRGTGGPTVGVMAGREGRTPSPSPGPCQGAERRPGSGRQGGPADCPSPRPGQEGSAPGGGSPSGQQQICPPEPSPMHGAPRPCGQPSPRPEVPAWGTRSAPPGHPVLPNEAGAWQDTDDCPLSWGS